MALVVPQKWQYHGSGSKNYFFHFWMNLAILSFLSYTWFFTASAMVLPQPRKKCNFTSVTVVVPRLYLQMIWRIVWVVLLFSVKILFEKTRIQLNEGRIPHQSKPFIPWDAIMNRKEKYWGASVHIDRSNVWVKPKKGTSRGVQMAVVNDNQNNHFSILHYCTLQSTNYILW